MRISTIGPIVTVLLLVALLAGCARSEPEPTPASQQTVDTASPTTVAAAPSPTPTPAPEAVPQAQAATTPAPSPTRRPITTLAPFATWTPAPTATPPPGQTARAAAAARVSAWSYETAACRLETSIVAQLGVQLPPAECGYLTVPEDRGQPGGPSIRLHVAVFRSTGPSPAPDPVVYLEGGPGGHAMVTTALTFEDMVAPFLARRDFVVFDQRGTGFSEPALDCPEYIQMVHENLDRDLSNEEGEGLFTEALFACRDRLVSEGANLAAYTSAENAADLEALRQALGYEEWNLYSISYGARLAQTVMRDFPEGVRSVVIDSGEPVEIDFFASTAPHLDRVLGVFFDGCATNTACSTAFPELETDFYQLVDQLNEAPVTNEVVNPLTGETFDVLTDGEGMIGFLFESLYATDYLPLLPEIISEAQNGSFEMLAFIQGDGLANEAFVSSGMYYSVRCAEEASFTTPEVIEASVGPFPRLQGYFDRASVHSICDAWGAAAVGPVENQAVESDIPTLVLSGEYDPITPPAWGQQIAANQSKSYFFEFPGISHGVSPTEGCAMGILLEFLDNLGSEPDASCIGELTGPEFLVPEAQIAMAPFSSELLGVSGVVPESWDEIAPAVYARSSLGIVAMFQQAVPDQAPGQFIILMAGQFGLDELPESTGTREANDLVWTLYSFEAAAQHVDMALAEGAGPTTYMVVVTSTTGSRDRYYDDVFLTGVDAFKPLP